MQRLAVLLLALTTSAWAGPVEQHLSLAGDSSSTIDITWTDGVSTAESVQYGLTTAYGSSATESSPPFTVPGESLYSHHLQLTGLASGMQYHYAIPSGADRTFTPDARSGYFTFVVYGDQGTSSTLGAGGSQGCSLLGNGTAGQNGIPEATATQAGGAGPNLGLYMGDCAYDSNASAPWDAWFAANVPVTADVAWLSAVGNHDEAPSGGQGPGTVLDGQNFFGRFFFPAPFASNGGWWSVDYGGVHFVFLSGDLYGNSAQLAWLRADLGSAAAQNANWRVVTIHQPIFCSSCDDGSSQGDPWEQGARTVFPAVFDSFGNTAHVDLVLQGHRHVYERTYELKAGTDNEHPVIDTASWDAVNQTYAMPANSSAGTVYVTSGGGGHSLHTFASGPLAWSAHRASLFHWLRVAVTPSTLSIQVHDTQAGTTYETFTISRSSGPRTDGGASPDSGMAVDGGGASPDAGAVPLDAGGGTDGGSGSAGSDAGTGPAARAGCGCGVSPPGWAAWLVVLLAGWARSKRARPLRQQLLGYPASPPSRAPGEPESAPPSAAPASHEVQGTTVKSTRVFTPPASFPVSIETRI